MFSGLPASVLAQYGIQGMHIPGMSMSHSAMAGMVSAASPITAGQMALQAGQIPGLQGNYCTSTSLNWIKD